MSRLVIEAENLQLSSGTGIATYATALAQAVRGSGHAPVGLFGTRSKVGSKNGFLDEVKLYDARLELRRPVGDFFRRARYWLYGDPLGARAQRLPLAGQVHLASSPITSGLFEAVYGVPHLSLRAEMHFKRYGALMQLTGLEGVGSFHATQPIALTLKGVPNLCTVHDIIPLRLPYATLNNKREHYELLSLLARKADRIVTVSEFSRQDFLSVFKEAEGRVVNTYQSVTLPPRLLSLSQEDVAQRIRNSFGLDYKGYFLFVGAIEPKKNVKRMIAGYAASGSKKPLVLAGALGWQYEGDVRAIEDERFLRYRMTGGMIRPERAVRRLDYVSRQDLVLLLRGARALVFPSLYEGFGLPVLEAMLAGTPVITSRVSSLPEIAEDAAEYVNPFEADTIANAISRLDKDDERCAELASKGLARAQFFSPERYQQRLGQLYHDLL